MEIMQSRDYRTVCRRLSARTTWAPRLNQLRRNIGPFVRHSLQDRGPRAGDVLGGFHSVNVLHEQSLPADQHTLIHPDRSSFKNMYGAWAGYSEATHCSSVRSCSGVMSASMIALSFSGGYCTANQPSCRLEADQRE